MRHLIAVVTLVMLACGSSKTRPDDEPEEPTVGQGQPCDDATCDDELTCVEYYGIAGPSGPKFASCEIPCVDDGACPQGQSCITIADGPGQVCRPPSP